MVSSSALAMLLLMENVNQTLCSSTAAVATTVVVAVVVVIAVIGVVGKVKARKRLTMKPQWVQARKLISEFM